MSFTPLELFLGVLILILVVIIGITHQSKSMKRSSGNPRKRATDTVSAPSAQTVLRSYNEGNEIHWIRENIGNDDRLVKVTDNKREVMLEVGKIEIDDRFNRWLGIHFIHHHTSNEDVSLYVIHRDNPDQLQKIGAWPTHRAGIINAFRNPSSLFEESYYGKMPLLLHQPDGMQLIRFSSAGEADLVPVIDPKLEHFLGHDTETAIEMILDTNDDDLIENVDEVECANAIDIMFSVKRESQDPAPNIDIYRLRFKDHKLEVECLHQGCTYYQQDYQGRFFIAAKNGQVGLYRRFTNEAVIEGFDADQAWAEDTVQIDGAWHHAFIGVKDSLPIVVMDGITKSVPASQGAAEIRIIDGEAYYQLESSDEVYDLYRFSDQKRMASFYGESPYLERQELSPGSRFRYNEDDAPEAEDAAPKAVPYHELAIRIN